MPQVMEIPFDIFDHILSFLISHPKCLVACSEAHPVLSRMAEKYRYYHVVISTKKPHSKYLFEPSYLTKLLSDKPRISGYIRVLQLEIKCEYDQMEPLEQVAAILPMFPVLESIILSIGYGIVSWEKHISQSFKKAVEDCLHLPTLQEVHIGCSDFPLSTLDNCANIVYLSLTGIPRISEFVDTTYPHLKSLSVENFHTKRDEREIFTAWAIPRITNLQSLKYDYISDSDGTLLGLLESCSDTLNNLDLSLSGFVGSELSTAYNFKRRYSFTHDIPAVSINLLSLPQLQHLTIRAAIYFYRGNGYDTYDDCISFLPAAMEVLKTASSLQQLTIEISINLTSSDDDQGDWATIDDVDLLPLTALAQFPPSFHPIDLYLNFDGFIVTHTKILSLLEGLSELIEHGALVIHLGTAPALIDLGSKRAILPKHRSLLKMFIP